VSDLLRQEPMLALLKDPNFGRFFRTVPKTQSPLWRPGMTPPWRVYVLLPAKKGQKGEPDKRERWARKDFRTYKEAYHWIVEGGRYKEWLDFALHSRRMMFPPPTRVVKISKGGRPVMVKGADGVSRQMTRLVPMRMPPSHEWCPYCRRPTVFGWFSRHHAFPDKPGAVKPDTGQRRCTICGISERGVKWRGGSD
jgi:hypothetical protein